MKVTIFTSNQPRHLNLARAFSKIADKVYVIHECNTVFPGQVNDFFKKSDVMQRYFSHVIESEKKIFGNIDFLPDNVNQMILKMGDLNKVPLDYMKDALQSDYYVVFGASYIKGPLIDHLVQNKCLNIHMGVSPYYRGNSTNFWALYHRKPEYVGATIHMLTKGLDSGPMLYHALPKAEKIEAFDLGMKAVESAHRSLVEKIKDNTIWDMDPVKQDKNLEISYTKNIDFNDIVAEKYLNDHMTADEIKHSLDARDLNLFLNPYLC